MQIKFSHPTDPGGPVVPWQPGEVLTVQITAAEADGSYTAETMETFAPDLKQLHAAQLAQLEADHRATVEQLLARLEPPSPEAPGGA